MNHPEASSLDASLPESSPYFVYSTASYWPNDHKLRDELSIPIALNINPLQPVENQASFHPAHINSYRCHSCKAFLNYLCTLRSANEYDCSICGCSNRVATSLDPNSVEMRESVYTCVTTNSSHRLGSPQDFRRTYFFVFDLTSSSPLALNFIHYAAQAVKQFIEQVDMGQQPLCSLGFLGFDVLLYEYSVDEDGSITKILNAHMEKMMIEERKFLHLPEQKEEAVAILDDMVETMKMGSQRGAGLPRAFLPALEGALTHSLGANGKIFFVSGISEPPGNFVKGVDEEPEQFWDNFSLNKKKCLPLRIQSAMEKTQMSVGFYLHTDKFINCLPLYALTKATNGELKHYWPSNYTQFYYEFSHALSEETLEMGTQAILKVRHSSGLKLVGIFGQYRGYKGSSDQIELISCAPSRSYMFEFAIEGRVQQAALNIQFSVLWTDERGRRVFKVITHRNKISGESAQIIDSIDYNFVNQSYLQAVLHNMDLNVRVRGIQLTLQERCKKHLKAIEKYKRADSDAVKRASPYIVFTFFLMRHFVMNTRFTKDVLYDKAIETKSRILTSDATAIHTIWPAVYSVSPGNHSIVQMRYEKLKQATESVIIDQGSYCYLYIVQQQLRENLLKGVKGGKQKAIDLVGQQRGLETTNEVLEEIRQSKLCGYVELVLMESLIGACIFDEKGPLSYDSFLSNLTSE